MLIIQGQNTLILQEVDKICYIRGFHWSRWLRVLPKHIHQYI